MAEPALVASWDWCESGVLAGQVVRPGDRVLVSGGAGDVALAALVAGAAQVRVAAGSDASAALGELKYAAARTLPPQTRRALFGFDAPGRRIFLLHYVRDGSREGSGPAPPGLSPPSREFWGAHEALVREGLTHAGQQEQAAFGYRRTLKALGLVARGPDGALRLAASRRRLRFAAYLPFGRDRAVALSQALPELVKQGQPLARWFLGADSLPPHSWLAADPSSWGEFVISADSLDVALRTTHPQRFDVIELGALPGTLDPHTLLDELRPRLRPGARVVLALGGQAIVPSGWRRQPGSWADLRHEQCLVLQPD